MNKLLKYLDHNGISQRKFAQKIGTGSGNLYLILHNKSSPSLMLAYKIEQATGGLVTMYDWIKEEWKNPPASQQISC